METNEKPDLENNDPDYFHKEIGSKEKESTSASAKADELMDASPTEDKDKHVHRFKVVLSLSLVALWISMVRLHYIVAVVI